ncbi:hypothetical protein AGOR_G00030510 [Albula goreensis]|uniref:Uncharacterized protein n=1 Tax=Albula goreensis TaxID=1534307 RepID=A0A8T3E7X5_9TELE|nr:hypothetical protein AGOR_G00030510 [Albula goreensis]
MSPTVVDEGTSPSSPNSRLCLRTSSQAILRSLLVHSKKNGGGFVDNDQKMAAVCGLPVTYLSLVWRFMTVVPKVSLSTATA